jgi:hypothetical protein
MKKLRKKHVIILGILIFLHLLFFLMMWIFGSQSFIYNPVFAEGTAIRNVKTILAEVGGGGVLLCFYGICDLFINLRWRKALGVSMLIYEIPLLLFSIYFYAYFVLNAWC